MNSCKIIMYHYVRPIKTSSYPKIKGLELEGFIRQIEYFRRNFDFITVQQLLDCIYNNAQIPKNSIILTFDDGIKDHYQYVFPILKKFNIQGLFFPPAKPIEERVVLGVHKIHFILANSKNIKKMIAEIFTLIEQHKEELDLNSPQAYFSNLAIASRFDTKEVIFIKRILQRELPPELRSRIVDHLFQEIVTDREELFSKELYLSFEEIEEMKKSGMYFGSHGYAHEWLPYLTDNELEIEINKSLDFYHKINHNLDDLIMCHPYGSYSNETIKVLEKKGFKAGLTTEVGDAVLTKSNAFTLRRYDTNDFPQ